MFPVFKTVSERDNAVKSFLTSSNSKTKQQLAEAVENQFYDLLAQIDGGKKQVYEYFDPDSISVFNVELFSDLLFYGYNKVLRYRPRYGYEPIEIQHKLNMYELLFDQKLLYRSITSFTPFQTRKYPTGLTVTASVTFAGAHFLPEHHALCKYLHGHEWKVEVMYGATRPDEYGMVVDFGVVKEVLKKEVVARFDHNMLNDTLTNPTAEHLAVFIYNHIYDAIDGLITTAVYETPTNRATAR